MASKQATFRLLPFAAPAHLLLSGTVERCRAFLRLRYVFEGETADLVLPASVASPGRKGDLWRDTCCEFFLKVADRPDYWEFNLSPSGNWNVYRFSGYRASMAEEPDIASLSLLVKAGGDRLELDCVVDLQPIGLHAADLVLAISAVTRDRRQGLQYWALIHPGPKPDFHAPEGFVLHLADETASRNG